MVTQPNNSFRKEAQRSASPELLDQLVQVVSPRRWLSLAALGGLVATGAVWSVVGRIPITVTGKGVLVYPSEVVAIQAPSAGRLLEVSVQSGDTVKKGQVLATIDQSELQTQLQLSRDKLAQLRVQDQVSGSAQFQRGNLDQSAIVQQRKALQQSLQTVQSLTPILRAKGLDSIQTERLALQQHLKTLREQLPTYRDRWTARQGLFQEGAVPQDTVLQAKQEYQGFQTQIDQAELQLKQLDTKEAEAQREYLRNVNQIDELQAQLKALDSKNATQIEQDLNTTTTRKKEIQETERAIVQLGLQLQKSSQIVSDYDGQILEVTAKSGQQIQAGAGIGTISAPSSNELVSVVFLPDSEGKKIQPGMEVQITPSLVKREEFGGIKGKVKTSSAFPVTQQGAASLVGNPDILKGVLSDGAQIAIFTDLESDSTFSGYRWSSSTGPQAKLTSGTTTSVRITIEEKAPISYVLPILKSWAGVN